MYKVNVLRQIRGEVRVRRKQRKAKSRECDSWHRFLKLNSKDLPITGFSAGGSSECIGLMRSKMFWSNWNTSWLMFGHAYGKRAIAHGYSVLYLRNRTLELYFPCKRSKSSGRVSRNHVHKCIEALSVLGAGLSGCSPPPQIEIKIKKSCRLDYVKCFTWFTLKPKSVTVIFR